MTILPTTASLSATPTWDGDRRVAGGALAGDPPAPQGDDELTFSDLLSVINPLQHLPVISTLYRWVTGDTIKPAARVVGGALYGGPIGLVSAAFNAVVEQVKGADVGAQLLAYATSAPNAPEGTPPVAVAAAAPQDGNAALSQDESNAAALRQLAADLRSPEPAAGEPKAAPAIAAAPLSGPTRSLAFYQANAGQRLAATDGGRGRPAPHYAMPASFQAASAKPLPLPVAEEKNFAAEQAVLEGAPTAWFASAMMRGLDRYRASQQQLNKPPSQVDLSP